jgi:hypothetical protein
MYLSPGCCVVLQGTKGNTLFPGLTSAPIARLRRQRGFLNFPGDSFYVRHLK